LGHGFACGLNPNKPSNPERFWFRVQDLELKGIDFKALRIKSEGVGNGKGKENGKGGDRGKERERKGKKKGKERKRTKGKGTGK
jgi:hypothetical protein